MSQVQTAALLLAAAVVGIFLLVAIIRYQRRRNAEAIALDAPFEEPSFAAPDTLLDETPEAAPEAQPELPRAARSSKFSRKSRVEEPPVEMAPERLARISAKPAADRLSDTDDLVEPSEDGTKAEALPDNEIAAPEEETTAAESSDDVIEAPEDDTNAAQFPDDGSETFENETVAVETPDEGYDIADPAFYPADWEQLLEMVAILESRLDQLTADGSANIEARERAEEIIAIVRDSAGEHDFSTADAASVMDALQAISWTVTLQGDDDSATLTLALTRHHPDAPSWVDAYRRARLARDDAASSDDEAALIYN